MSESRYRPSEIGPEGYREQPRRYFDPKAMEELKASIRAHGILEPVIVTPIQGEVHKYTLVAGQRRFRAVEELGFTEIPASVKHLSDEQVLQISLVENLQRQDLNPIEEVEATLELVAIQLEVGVEMVPEILRAMRYTDLNGQTHKHIPVIEETFKKLGKPNWHSFVNNKLPLINLYPDILEGVRQGKLSYTKARILGKVENEIDRDTLIDVAINDNTSHRELVKMVKIATKNTPKSFDERVFKRITTIRKRYKKNPPNIDDGDKGRLEELLEELENLLGEEGEA